MPQDVVLVLGNTGCGKSTLTKYLSGVDGDLKAVLENDQILIKGKGIDASISSVTQVPELVTNNATGTHFFDCPGFEDTRSPCVEVSSTFYLKEIARNARRVKVLLLAPYFAVRRGQDRSDFLTMLRHAARTLHAVSKMRASIALVVTKVEAVSKVKGRFTVKPDASVREGIATFLREDVQLFLRHQDQEAADSSLIQEERQRMEELVNIFLQQSEDKTYNHIGIFRVPDEEGKLTDMQLMEDGRKALNYLVQDQLLFVDVAEEDFDFSVSERTKVFVHEQSRALSDAMEGKLSAMGVAMAAARASSPAINGSVDVPAVAQHCDEAAKAIQVVAEYVANSSTIESFCNRIHSIHRITWIGQPTNGYQEPSALPSDLADECRFLAVLQVVSNEPLVRVSEIALKLAQPLREAAGKLDARRDWHRLLVTLYDRLNEFADQSRRARGLASFTPVTASNVSILVEQLPSLGLLRRGHSEWNPEELNQLNALLARTRSGPDCECLDGVLVLRGETVLLSEVVTRVQGGAGACLASCRKPVTSVEVYALNTVFVDADVRLPGLGLAVVAPRWEVIGNAVVDLDGLPGAPPDARPSQASFGRRGVNGEPGRPGRPGGHFLGVGLDFAGVVQVSVRGGAGGDGQDGGDGARGYGRPTQYECSGEKGGDGGVGGVGGPAGSARLLGLRLQTQPSANLIVRDGAQGAGGRGGLGGVSCGVTLRRSKRFEPITGAIAIGAAIVGAGGYFLYKSANPPTTPAPIIVVDGARGRDGYASAGWQSAAAQRPAPWQDVPRRTAAYLELNSNHPYRRQLLQQFKLLLSHRGTRW